MTAICNVEYYVLNGDKGEEEHCITIRRRRYSYIHTLEGDKAHIFMLKTQLFTV